MAELPVLEIHGHERILFSQQNFIDSKNNFSSRLVQGQFVEELILVIFS